MDGPDTFAAEFDIIGAQVGWLLIRDATQGGYGGPARQLVFAGPAWVSTRLVSFTTGSLALRSGPSSRAPTVAALHGTGQDRAWGPDSVVVERILGCQGRYADVWVRLPDGRRLRGWVDGTCSNQVTTCS